MRERRDASSAFWVHEPREKQKAYQHKSPFPEPQKMKLGVSPECIQRLPSASSPSDIVERSSFRSSTKIRFHNAVGDVHTDHVGVLEVLTLATATASIVGLSSQIVRRLHSASPEVSQALTHSLNLAALNQGFYCSLVQCQDLIMSAKIPCSFPKNTDSFSL